MWLSICLLILFPLITPGRGTHIISENDVFFARPFKILAYSLVTAK